jgi:hypothetical protein
MEKIQKLDGADRDTKDFSKDICKFFPMVHEKNYVILQ